MMKKRGFLARPNIKLYYQAAVLVWITDWIKNPDERLTKLETADLDEGPRSYFWIKKLTQKHNAI